MKPFTPRDRLWLWALPVYVLFLVFRHEAAHAWAAVVLDGATLTEFALLPGFDEAGNFRRPHVSVEGDVSWVTYAAPYVLDMVSLAVFVPLGLWYTRMPKALWLNLVILGVAVPAFNALGNWVLGLPREQSDVGQLLAALPPALVHAVFLSIIVFGFWSVSRLRRAAATRLAR